MVSELGSTWYGKWSCYTLLAPFASRENNVRRYKQDIFQRFIQNNTKRCVPLKLYRPQRKDCEIKSGNSFHLIEQNDLYLDQSIPIPRQSAATPLGCGYTITLSAWPQNWREHVNLKSHLVLNETTSLVATKAVLELHVPSLNTFSRIKGSRCSRTEVIRHFESAATLNSREKKRAGLNAIMSWTCLMSHLLEKSDTRDGIGESRVRCTITIHYSIEAKDADI
jgi:hypothetical protein